MADTDQNEKSIVFAVDKNNLVRLVNAGGAEILKTGIDRVPSLTQNELDKSIKQFGSPEAVKKGIESMNSVITTFTNRDSRKEFLAKLGVTADTPDNYRLVAYIDPVQTVLFKGSLQGDKIVATESYVPPKELQGLSTISTSAAIGSGQIKMAELLSDVIKNSFKKLPKPIEIPAQKSEKENFDKNNGIEIQTIKFTPDQSKKLEEQVTLLALADKALHGNIALSGSNARLPHNVKNERGAQV